MEKEPQPDSLTTVTIKPDYPPSEVYGSEPPPAYHRSQSSAVQVAKIIAVTVVLVSVVLGSFLLASAYVTANASCRQLEQELELFNEAADRLQAPLQPEALVQAEPLQQKQNNDNVKVEAQKNVNDVDSNSVDAESDDNESSSSSDDSSSSSESDERIPIRIKLPLQLDFDDLAGALIEKNQKSRMNCIVEKKRAEEIVDHQPKTLRLPFGLNLTTDPRYERISGEKMAIFCETGNSERHAPTENRDDDDEVSTIMVQPVMIPIPQTHFPTHMPQQMRPIPQQQPHPMETMRPPMPAPIRGDEQNQLPPNQILHQIAQEIIAQKIMEAREQQNADSNPEQNQQVVAQRIPIPEEILSQLNRLPNRDMIVTVAQEYDVPQEASEAQAQQQEMRIPEGIRIVAMDNRPVMQDMRKLAQQMPVPQQVQILPQEMAPGQDAQAAPQEMPTFPAEMHAVPPQVQVVQQQRDNAQEKNGRQSYARMFPVHIPVNMIQQGQVEAQDAPAEETRPHYVQPRSVRSVDALVPKSEKRVKRCSCDCAC